MRQLLLLRAPSPCLRLPPVRCRAFGSHPVELSEPQIMRPEIVAAPTAFNCAVLDKCVLFKREYTKPLFLFNSHAETIWGSWYRTNLSLELDREYVDTPDGGVVTLDALKHGGAVAADAPVLIMLPGLAGGSSCSYVQYAIRSANEAGLRPVVFNSRGTASSPVRTAQFYSASFTEDLRLVVNYVSQKFPRSHVCAIGWSLGANILVNYLAEEGSNSTISAAASLCNPFDLVRCDQNLKKGFGRLYDWNLASSMQKFFQDHLHLFKGYDIDKALSATTVRGVDDAITRVTFGWESVDAYYKGSSSADRIGDVGIPLLCVQAADDPISISSSIPREAIQANEHCTLVVTPYGGHLGWVTADSDSFFGAPWTDKAVLEWFSAVLENSQRGSVSDNAPELAPQSALARDC